MPTAELVLARLAEDCPHFHGLSEGDSRYLASVGVDQPAGEWRLAVTPAVLRRIAGYVTSEMVTLETGAGDTTVLLAAATRRHYCCTFRQSEADGILAYLRQIGVPDDRLTFMIGSSDVTLPLLKLDQPLDFAYIDGCHGYPFPAMDWHHIDQRLKVGGVIGLDNVELRPVREHCNFLDANGSYELIEELVDDGLGYYVRFYRKLKDELREWIFQEYSRVRQS